MNKRSQITHVTPLPSYVSRDAVLELLHDHSTIITLNPLVTHHGRTRPPEHALPDEHSSAWYEITDKIEYIPGTSLTGSVTYTACMHDLPNGLQTHIHAPGGLEIRGKWQLLGWLPGEERDAPEIGTEQHGIPREGLYLREDCDLKCNFFLTHFVKKSIHKSHKVLVKRLLKLASERTAPNGRRAKSANTEEVEVRVISDSPSRPDGATSPFNEQRQRNVLEWQSKGYSVSVSGGTQQNVTVSRSSSARQDQISRRGRSQSPGYAFVKPSLGSSKRYPSEGPSNRRNRDDSPVSRPSTNSSE
ncbi:hypothetical protein TMatcc_009513 [Talaromyces marneffei ATCC 18224]|uniref:DUF7053 domain-containing protein n=2 Tax=Talaromyces marneffei TaxID=37727 RepID=B6QSQ7_TALMQ|nr:uncharacterized protein EYB26_008765 [Talaromyces marneffei]EEA19381.1 hypothetical protein PMAA_001760 [Talaromyces marneffei ATCC 18224]KAE8547702.1 hypothetical protein EYB25_009495 [Talaromyces marneffei]QGA21055.1 hypothetical protein EYB26_008765 [Talaromyces marneffei]